MPEPQPQLDDGLAVPEVESPRRRRLIIGGVALLLIASAVVFVRAPRAVDSQEAMGQGLPSTFPGETVPLLTALAVGFVPDGFTLAAEESDGTDRVVQRYVRDGQVIVVTTVVGVFNPSRTLDTDDTAEPVDVGEVAGVVQRGINETTGAEQVSVRIPVGDSHNVIVRGVGGVDLADLLAVAASVAPQES